MQNAEPWFQRYCIKRLNTLIYPDHTVANSVELLKLPGFAGIASDFSLS